MERHGFRWHRDSKNIDSREPVQAGIALLLRCDMDRLDP
jgi:hypothetical protein